MSIAVVESLLVLAIFMQLRYDNPINAMIVAFSLLGVGLFIGFTALDLTTRDRIYDFKAGQVVPGGTGVFKLRQQAPGPGRSRPEDRSPRA